MAPLDELNMKVCGSIGWKSADVITSVSSSSVGGLMSTTLKLSLALSRDQRLMRRSSAERKVAPSALTEMELTW
jgi:hypothetical protein